jgi:hypothetical protein
VTIHRGFLAVDPALLEWVLSEAASTRTAGMSAIGNAWQSHRYSGERYEELPFLPAAVVLVGENSRPFRVHWWANVLFEGGEHYTHTHDGKWSFVYHLTEGTAVHFGKQEAPESFPAMPGQLLVFASNLPHRTDRVEGDAPRVSIAGNLHFRGPART